MTGHDVRWRQRSSNFRRALARLVEAVELSGQRTLTDLERQGLIQAFEFTHELSWKTLKDFLASQGIEELYGSSDTTREAFAQGLETQLQDWERRP